MAKSRVRVAAVVDPVAADAVPAPKNKPLPLPKGWSRAADALDRVESVVTIFPDFNRATGCGGLPINRMHTVHGPTHGGKTAFVFGLMKSFVDGDHVVGYIDAEHSTPQEFASELMGDLERFPLFFAKRPQTYEETINSVGELLDMVSGMREKQPEKKLIIVVDSINKLTPARELTNVLKSGGSEVAKGHAGRYRAAINQAWLNHLSPRLKAAGCAMVFIAQERDQADAEVWDVDGGVSIKGGQALSFDASLLIRVSKSEPVRDNTTATDKKKGRIVGFVHKARIYKSKVGHMEGAFTDCVFHFSNGKLSQPGFDIGRDAIHVAKSMGMFEISGSWLSWHRTRWQSEAKGAAWLAANPESLSMLLSEITAELSVRRKK